jgi:hypothetical protein
MVNLATLHTGLNGLRATSYHLQGIMPSRCIGITLQKRVRVALPSAGKGWNHVTDIILSQDSLATISTRSRHQMEH